jgi:hypothetical protein
MLALHTIWEYENIGKERLDEQHTTYDLNMRHVKAVQGPLILTYHNTYC